MANTYDLTQTGSEVQAILNDANNIKGAGAQTTLTTDYILLKDTNGQYHKILKDSFTEACRNVLAGLLVNNDKGTTISQIAAVASGDFGSVTPANLASVLGVKLLYSNTNGVPSDRIIPADGDCMNINDGGLWQISGGTSIDEGPAHSPKKNEWFYVFAYGSVGALILLAIQTRGVYSYIGIKRDGDITWKQITVTT